MKVYAATWKQDHDHEGKNVTVSASESVLAAAIGRSVRTAMEELEWDAAQQDPSQDQDQGTKLGPQGKKATRRCKRTRRGRVRVRRLNLNLCLGLGLEQ